MRELCQRGNYDARYIKPPIVPETWGETIIQISPWGTEGLEQPLILNLISTMCPFTDVRALKRW